jgi:hypothetical protein
MNMNKVEQILKYGTFNGARWYQINGLECGLSNCGMHTIIGTPKTVYRYADLIKNLSIKRIQILKNK